MQLIELRPRPFATDVRLGDLIKPLVPGRGPRVVMQIKTDAVAGTVTFIHGPHDTTTYPATCRVGVLRRTSRVVRVEAGPESESESTSHVWFVRAS